MSSILRAAWRVVARRSRSDLAVLLAVFTTALMAVALVSSGPIYADATTSSSLQRTLADAPLESAAVIIETRVVPDTFAEDDSAVVTALDRVFEAIPTEIHRRATSDSYTPLQIDRATESDLIVFRSYTGLEDRAHLITGEWPSNSGEAIDVAIPTSVAEHLGLSVGSIFEAVSRADKDASYPVSVVGIFEIADATDNYWLEDELDLTGAIESTTFTTRGPFVVDSAAFFATVGGAGSKTRWSAFPEQTAISVDDIDRVVTGLSGLERDLNAGRDVGNQTQVITSLDSTLRDAERALLVTRSAVLTISIQLAVLAGYALLLAAGLLADSREVESATISARGASTAQLVAMAVMEGLIVAVPAMVIGPLLAAWALRMFNVVGPLAVIDLTIDPKLSPTAWLLAAIAAFGCLLAIAAPAYFTTRRRGDIRSLRSRAQVGVVRRYGVDFAVLVIASLGIWQLATYGSSITATVRGRVGIDPFLVAAPALALLAGSILALRLMPMLAHLAEGLVRGSRSLVAPLGIRHLGRQPKRYARSALMLILALAIGVFALGYNETWTDSQQDRADYLIGADIDVTPSQVVGGSIASPYLPDAHTTIEDVVASTPTLRTRGELAGLNKPVEFLLLEPETASGILHFRADLAEEPLQVVLGRLSEARPSLPALELPGEPRHLGITVAYEPEPPRLGAGDDLGNYSPAWYEFDPTLRAVLVDGSGLTFRIDLGPLMASTKPVEMRAEIEQSIGTATGFSPRYPVSLIGLEVRGLAPFAGLEQRARLRIAGFAVSDDGSQWSAVDLSVMSPVAETSNLRLASTAPTFVADGTSDGLQLVLGTGATTAQTRQPVYHAVWTGELPEVENISVVTDSGLANELNLGPGDLIPLEDLPGFGGSGTLTSTVESFPTVDPGASHVIVADLASFHIALLAPGTNPPPPTRFWLDIAEGGDADRIAAELANSPFNSPRVLSRTALHQELVLDPVALGTIGSLLAGLVAGAVLAAIGFLVNSIVSNRERLGQFALMKAVGLRATEVVRWVSIENGVTVVFGSVVGAALGAGLARLILPLTALTETGSAITPDLEVHLPLLALASLAIFALALFMASVLVVRRMVRRLRIASLLRGGGE